MIKKTLGKINKYIISRLYFIGLSKNDIYSTLKRNGVNIKRNTIRKYLSGKLSNKRGIYKQHNKYNEKITGLYDKAVHYKRNKKAGLPALTWAQYHDQKQGLEDNYLKSTILFGLSKNRIHTGNRRLFISQYGRLVKWNEYTHEWESP